MWIIRAIVDELLCKLFGHKWYNERTTLNPETRMYQNIQNCSRCGRYEYVAGTEQPIKDDLKYKL